PGRAAGGRPARAPEGVARSALRRALARGAQGPTYLPRRRPGWRIPRRHRTRAGPRLVTNSFHAKTQSEVTKTQRRRPVGRRLNGGNLSPDSPCLFPLGVFASSLCVFA